MATPVKRKRADGSVAGEDGPQQFHTMLQELKTNAQSKIKQLTALAEANKDSVEVMSRDLSQEIMGAQSSRLQPLFMVVDSIMKKLGKEYRTHLVAILPQLLQAALAKAERQQKIFLTRLANESWKKHDLLPADIAHQVDMVLTNAAAAAPADPGQVKMEVQQPASSSFVAVKDEALAGRAGLATSTPAPPPEPAAPGEPKPAGAPRMKGPPPKPPVKLEVQAQAAAKAAPAAQAAEAAPAETEVQLMERRLTILAKIMERKGTSPEDLREIMRVPEVVKAMTMQRQGARTEAMTLLSEYKAELEKVVRSKTAAAKPADPRDPRQSEAAKAADPRQAEKPQDPRQAARLNEAKQLEASTGKRVAEAQAADPRQKKASKKQANADCIVLDDDDEDEDDDVQMVDPLDSARKVLQGLPSLGFSEDWLRQFIDTVPVKGQEASNNTKKGAAVGRKILGAEGEQMVYVDELSPSEVLLLMQLIFLMEERLKHSNNNSNSSGGLDITERIPHTFSYMQMDQAIDVMLKRLFDELPHQCMTTGLRFANREKLRKHNDALHRRRAAQKQKQLGAEARGWMENIPEWVGNRDLVVGPALFQLGGGAAMDEANAQRAQRSAALEDADREDGEEDDSERSRWICPFDERRSVCPISGEPFQREWNETLNDWAFADVVAVELGEKETILRFPPKNPKDPERLTESAFLFKKSCYLNTPLSQRLAALEDCHSRHALGKPQDKLEVITQDSQQQGSETAKNEAAKLASLLAEASATPRKRFF